MKTKLLIVDDEPDILSTLERYFSMHDFSTVTAQNATEALKVIENEKVNIALLDINMPEMDGIELLKKIKKWDFSIQVIMMTAYSTFDKTLRSLEMGASDYVLKPFDNLDDVLELVNDSLKRLIRWRKNLLESVKLKKDFIEE